MKTLAWLLAFGSGFLSLSEEILWVRLFGFVHHGVPQAFSLVLALYLLGIALGAVWGKRLCERYSALPLVAAATLVLAGALDLALPWLLVQLAGQVPLLQLLGMALALIASSALKAVLFPVAHHLGSQVEDARLGRSLSRVYFMNIVGSTLGPLLTGFVLLDYLSLDDAYRWIGALCWLMAAGCLATGMRRRALALTAAAAASLLSLAPGQHRVIVAYASGAGDQPVKSVISNRHGVLHTLEGGDKGDVVYGGNVYDGRTNLDLAINSNRIDRAYLLAALHPNPRRLLVIGMSTGAWLRVLSAIPSVEQIDVVEINPGYLELIHGIAPLAAMLDDPRIKVHVDDGRRWLKRHADNRYDLIVMNTTFHWRAYTTNLLSQQFLSMASEHLLPGGIMAFNTTGSPDAVRTASAVFAHTYRWSNFVYASNSDFRNRLAEPAAPARLAAMKIDGRVLLPAEQARYGAAVQALLDQAFVDLAAVARQTPRPLEVIDDDAMQTEFRYGKGLVF
ncbi:MAG TPA: hypothetical protein VLA16_14325 [Ideonella sp.]|nr:hypothetical protein [Ideonella sp.]